MPNHVLKPIAQVSITDRSAEVSWLGFLRASMRERKQRQTREEQSDRPAGVAEASLPEATRLAFTKQAIQPRLGVGNTLGRHSWGPFGYKKPMTPTAKKPLEGALHFLEEERAASVIDSLRENRATPPRGCTRRRWPARTTSKSNRRARSRSRGASRLALRPKPGYSRHGRGA